MYKRVGIQNFRGFGSFELPDLGSVNLVTGQNGCGKTALLEALFLLAGGDNSALVMNIATMRGLMSGPMEVSTISSQLWETLFHDLESATPIELNAVWEEGPKRVRQTVKLSLGYPGAEVLRDGDQIDLHSAGLDAAPRPDAFLQWEHHQSGRTKFKTRLIVDEDGLRIDPAPRKAFAKGHYLPTRTRLAPQSDAERLGKLELRGDVEGFLDALRVVEPGIRRVTTVSRGGVPIVHADIGLKTLLPLALLGDGVSRLASIMLGIADSRDGVTLIDEIENGFHYSTHGRVWQAVLAAAKNYNAQVFASSHSLECVRASARPLAEWGDEVRLIRIERTSEGPAARTFLGEQVIAALSGNVEIR